MVPIPFLRLFPSIMLPMFLAMIDQTIVATALPTIAAELGGMERVSWVVVFYLMATVVSAPVSGRLADALGRRRLLIIALIVSMVGSVMCALSTSLEMLIASRVLQGLGGGGLMALSQALIGQSVEPRERARFQGYIAAVAVTANLLGPVVGGLLTDVFGWRSIFLVNLPLALLAIELVMRLPEPPLKREALRFDWTGLLLLNVAVWTLFGFVNEIRQPLDASPLVAVGFVMASLLAVVLLMRRERRASAPLLPIPLLRNPSIWRSNGLSLCQGALVVSLITYSPFYLRAVHGASASEIGLFMLPLTMGVGVGSVITGQIISRTGRTAILPSFGLMGVTLILVFLGLNAGTMPLWSVAGALGAVTLLLGTVMGVVHVTVMSEAGSKLLGTASGMVQLSRSLGAALGATLVGVVLFIAGALYGVDMSGELQQAAPRAPASGRFADVFRYAFFTIAVYSAGACLLAWTLPRRRL